jgi:heme/copper-type cytochrome/quinol oxidase subunit 2
MPFFATSHYLSNAAKVWIWVVCTIPSTVIAFTFYFYWKRREEQAKRTSLDDDGNEWHGMNR